MRPDGEAVPASAPGPSASGAHAAGRSGGGLWLFIFLDMVVFLLLFAVHPGERFRIPDVFARSQPQLDPAFAFANALILPTGSWAMVKGVEAAREGAGPRARGWLTACRLLGAAFAVGKVVECHGKIARGVGPTSDGFHTFHFLLTGIHFLHVVGTMVFIVHCRNRAAREAGSARFLGTLENTGLFWHFVDLLWLFIFPLLYLASP